MSELTQEDCPAESPKGIAAINMLTNEQLVFEIEAGSRSRFGAAMQPALKLALQKRRRTEETAERQEELNIARKANEIAERALTQSELANRKSDQTRLWAALAVLVSVILAAIGWLRS